MFLILNIILSLSLSSATTFDLKKEAGTTVFKATALGLKFEGNGSGPHGSIKVEDKVSGEILVDLESLDTGIGLRNTHMKENYLETKKFPEAKLKINEIPEFRLDAKDGNYKFTGNLVVRNIEKPIENGQLKIKKTATGYEIEAQFDTKISDFSIPIPKYAGLALKDAVHIEVKSLASEAVK